MSAFTIILIVIVAFLAGTVLYAYAAREIDKREVYAYFLLNLDSKLEEYLSKLGIVACAYGIACQKSVYAEVLYAVFLELFVSDFYLLFGHTVFCVLGGIHYLVVESEVAAWIVTAAHFFRQAAHGLFHRFNVRNIVQIDDGAHVIGIFKLVIRRVVGGKHNVLTDGADRLREHQFRFGRAVTAAAVFTQDLNNKGIRRSFYSKILFEALVPGKRFIEVFRIPADALFIVKIKRRRVLGRDLLQCIGTDKRCFLHFSILLFPQQFLCAA